MKAILHLFLKTQGIRAKRQPPQSVSQQVDGQSLGQERGNMPRGRSAPETNYTQDYRTQGNIKLWMSHLPVGKPSHMSVASINKVMEAFSLTFQIL